jgi:hypothetical protein
MNSQKENKEGELFDKEEENKERIDAAQFNFDEAEYKEKLKANDQVVYEMYNKYRFLLEELNLYKEKLLDHITNNEIEGEGEGDVESEEPLANLTPEQKDYKLYLLAKELSLTRWNSSLQGQVHVLKENNIQNNAHIREQKIILDEQNRRLQAFDENINVLKDSLKDFKAETKMKLHNVPRDKGISEVMIKGELNPLNDIVIKLTKYIKDKVESELLQMEKERGEKSESNIKAEAIKELNSKFNELVLEIGDKADKTELISFEQSLSEAIDEVKNRSQIKITSLKDIADDESLQKLFAELIDGRYIEYEKKIGKVFGKMDKIENDIERCFDDYEHTKEIKRDIMRNEQKLDRIYSLMELNAFGKNNDVTCSDIEEEEEEEPSQKNLIVKQNELVPNINTIENIRNIEAKSVANSDADNVDMDKLMPSSNKKEETKSSKSISEIKSNKVKIIMKKKSNRVKDSVPSQQINAIKVMFVKLESRVDEINRRLTEREYQDELITNTVGNINQSFPGLANSSPGALVHSEFIGVKHLVGRHQMSITK